MVKYKNNAEFFEALKLKKNEIKQLNMVNGSRSITNRNYSQAIAITGDVYASEKGFMIYDYDEHTVSRNEKLIKKCINEMQKGTSESNSVKITHDVMYMLDDEENLIQQKPVHKTYRHFLNGIYNLETKERVIDEGWTFFNIVTYNLKNLDEVDPFSLAVVKKILSDWSDGNKEKEQQIKEIVFSIIEGRSRKKLVLLIGPGGNGKSIFLDLCNILAGKGGSVICNLNEINDDNKLNEISDSTNIIIGDDLATNAKLSGEKLSRFKQLISGSPISLNVKYEKDIIIRNKATFIQATNSDVNFYENNASILRRLYVLKWTTTLFDKNEKTFVTYTTKEGETIKREYILDDLIDERDNNFIEAFISYIIYTTDYFEKFTMSDESIMISTNMIEESDQVKLFFDTMLEAGLFYNTYIPTKLIYQKYQDMVRDENPGSKPLNVNNFYKRLTPMMNDMGYIKFDTTKRYKSFDIFDFNEISLFSQYDLDSEISPLSKSKTYNKFTKNESSAFFYNKDFKISEDQFLEMKNQIHTKKIPKKIDNPRIIWLYICALYDLCINNNNTYLSAKILNHKHINTLTDIFYLPITELQKLLDNL